MNRRGIAEVNPEFGFIPPASDGPGSSLCHQRWLNSGRAVSGEFSGIRIRPIPDCADMLFKLLQGPVSAVPPAAGSVRLRLWPAGSAWDGYILDFTATLAW